MAMIGITTCRKLEDYRQAILHVGAEVRILDSSMGVDDALTGVDGLLLTGGEDVSPDQVRGSAARDDRRRGSRTRQFRNRAGQRCASARPADLCDLPRHPGAERRVWRHAGAGHPVAGSEARSTHSLPVPPNEPYSLAHEVWLDKDSLLAKLMGERLSDADACDVNSRHHQAVKDVAPGFTRVGDRARRGDRSDRGSGALVLPRRPVASGELLAHRRVPSAVRGLRRSRRRERPSPQLP